MQTTGTAGGYDFLAENILGKSRLHALCQMDFDARCQIPVIHEQQTEFC